MILRLKKLVKFQIVKNKNCNCAIKCDASGCGNLAKKEITFKGIETDLRLCGKCYEELCNAVFAGVKQKEKDKK